MCLDCGCCAPNDQHGDPNHLTMEQVEKAAKASKISVDEAMKNINKTVKEAQGGASAQKA
ncbi:hypothetical protein BH23CHL4_BH23CHL4_02290 [soil metagenome]